jgi:hypothetical protein
VTESPIYQALQHQRLVEQGAHDMDACPECQRLNTPQPVPKDDEAVNSWESEGGR